MGELKNKVALITGAGKKSGIGFAIARAFSGEGAHNPAFALLAALFLWTGSRTYAADAARAKKIELEAERVK